MYFQAELPKQAAQWTSEDGYSALYVVLHRPHFMRFALPESLLAAAYPVLQLSAIITLVFERGALLMPVVLWLHATRQRGGRWRFRAVGQGYEEPLAGFATRYGVDVA